MRNLYGFVFFFAFFVLLCPAHARITGYQTFGLSKQFLEGRVDSVAEDKVRRFSTDELVELEIDVFDGELRYKKSREAIPEGSYIYVMNAEGRIYISKENRNGHQVTKHTSFPCSVAAAGEMKIRNQAVPRFNQETGRYRVTVTALLQLAEELALRGLDIKEVDFKARYLKNQIEVEVFNHRLADIARISRQPEPCELYSLAPLQPAEQDLHF